MDTYEGAVCKHPISPMCSGYHALVIKKTKTYLYLQFSAIAISVNIKKKEKCGMVNRAVGQALVKKTEIFLYPRFSAGLTTRKRKAEH